MSRPVIGITCAAEPASWRVWRDVPTVLLPHAYVREVQQAGGTAILLPPLPVPAHPGDDQVDVRDVLRRLDGLVLSGGADVEPGRYDEVPHPSVQEPRPDRDDWELALARASSGTSLPVLGVCRGMQVMAVAAGGSLVQHLPDEVGHDGHAPDPGAYASHAVRTAPGSRLRELLGERVEVPTYHHQSVRTHPGYVPSAWAEDGTVEGLEDAAVPFRLGVQWHPEAGEDPRLFRALVAAAAAARDGLDGPAGAAVPPGTAGVAR